MKTTAKLLLSFSFLILLGCSGKKGANIERPHDPWVFRSVLDEHPRMVTIALHDDLWIAYHTETASLYKVWKGGVDFDGAVYNTVHGPQPMAIGDVWFENKHKNPWIIVKNGKELTPNIVYRGHIYQDGHVLLQYELYYEGGVIYVYEHPEYVAQESGVPAFERVFTTNEVPNGVEIFFKTNVSSIVSKDKISTTGDFEVLNTEPRKYKDRQGIDADGKLKLLPNGSVNLTINFLGEPLIEDPNKPDDQEAKELPLGYRLIARSDCKTCHNAFKETIGPSYLDVARKYRTTETNINTLVTKVKVGGSGVWGTAKMYAHPNESEEDIRAMVEYILSMDADDEAKLDAIEAAELPADAEIISGETVEDNQLIPGALIQFSYSAGERTKLADHNWEEFRSWQFYTEGIELVAEEFPWAVEDFSVQGSGYLYIPKTNNFVFRLNSVDGARLIIDGKTIVEMDGLSEMRTQDGEIILEEGYHPFKVQHIKGGKDIGLSLQWKSFNDAEFDKIPAAAFFHHKTKQKIESYADPVAIDKKQIPGDGLALTKVHPMFKLSQARPEDFTPKVGGMDFLSDGRLVVSTWDAAGSVYVVEGTETGDPSQMKATKIATGLAEPLGLKVVEDEIYVLQKQELTRLKDLNKDGIMDEYYSLSQGWKVSANFHEFAFGLVYKDDHFYATLATAINPGGASTQPQIPDRGKVVKIARSDGKTSFIAHGLRTPNGIGLGVDDEIFVADNQGDWLPASKIVHIQEGAWYGSRSVDFEGTAELTEKPPVVWLPQNEIGNSPSQPSIIKEGIYAGQMIHGEVTHGGVKRVFVERIGRQYQGAVFRFTQGLEAGINRLAWSPSGDLYVGGVGSTGNWGHEGKLYYGLQRLELQEETAFEMLAVRAKTYGIEIEFTEPLQEGDGWNPADYLIQQWWYEPTSNYGGPKKDVEKLKILSTNVSVDRKKVYLELEGMKENHVLYIQLQNHFVSTAGKELWTTEAWYTLNKIPKNQLGIKTRSTVEYTANTLTKSEKEAGWKLLFDGKTTAGWRNYDRKKIGSGWSVEDGTLTLDPSKKDGGDIITTEQFENYELRLDWKIAPCGNSGIIFNVKESDDYSYVWQTGPEMQILDNACHPDARYETHRAGDLYDMIACDYVTVNPGGEWNSIRLIVNNGKVEHWQNGHKVVEYEMFTNDWKKMIANSKFKEMEGFGTIRKGHIALQDHSDKVWFRNIKIRQLGIDY